MQNAPECRTQIIANLTGGKMLPESSTLRARCPYSRRTPNVDCAKDAANSFEMMPCRLGPVEQLIVRGGGEAMQSLMAKAQKSAVVVVTSRFCRQRPIGFACLRSRRVLARNGLGRGFVVELLRCPFLLRSRPEPF